MNRRSLLRNIVLAPFAGVVGKLAALAPVSTPKWGPSRSEIPTHVTTYEENTFLHPQWLITLSRWDAHPDGVPSFMVKELQKQHIYVCWDEVPESSAILLRYCHEAERYIWSKERRNWARDTEWKNPDGLGLYWYTPAALSHPLTHPQIRNFERLLPEQV